MAEDRLIKSGQFTMSRLLFMAVAGGLIVFFVYAGGVWLNVGYLILTLGLCALLFLVARDYGINMEKVGESARTGAAELEPATTEQSVTPAIGDARPRRRTTRTTKRRR